MVMIAYVILVLTVALQRLAEVRVSRMNEAALRARGGREHAPEQMPYMVALHASWLVACIAEVALLDRAFDRVLALPALSVFCAGQALRIAAIAALGERWTVKVIVLPGVPPVRTGIFRHLRHPNYLGVILELASLPLVHGAWLTALVFSAANGVLLDRRIAAEERALAAAGEGDAHIAERPDILPRRARGG